MSYANFPTLTRQAPTTGKFSLLTNTQTFESPLNRAVQTMELPGARWKAEFEFANLSEVDIRIIRAFIAKLRGAAGRFWIYDFTHYRPSGSALGTPLIKGASQTGYNLVTDGWTPNQSSLLLPGDYFQVNDELKMVVETASSNANGESTIRFEPPLRNSPTDNYPVILTKPSCLMRLDDDEQDSIIMMESRVGTFNLTATEVFQ